MKLTGILREIEEAAGRDAALAIAARYGGVAVNIGGSIARLKIDGWLVQCVGRAAAERIVKQVGAPRGIKAFVPHGPTRAFKPVIILPVRDRAASVKAATRAGKPARDLALKHNVSMRTIYRWRAAARSVKP